jgi:hypothetical protein
MLNEAYFLGQPRMRDSSLGVGDSQSLSFARISVFFRQSNRNPNANKSFNEFHENVKNDFEVENLAVRVNEKYLVRNYNLLHKLMC